MYIVLCMLLLFQRHRTYLLSKIISEHCWNARFFLGAKIGAELFLKAREYWALENVSVSSSESLVCNEKAKQVAIMWHLIKNLLNIKWWILILTKLQKMCFLLRDSMWHPHISGPLGKKSDYFQNTSLLTLSKSAPANPAVLCWNIYHHFIWKCKAVVSTGNFCSQGPSEWGFLLLRLEDLLSV